MKRLKAFKWILAILIILFLVTLFLVLQQSAYKTVTEGDDLLTLNLSRALEKYELAQKQWPLLRYDKEVQLRIEKTKEEIQRRKSEPVLSILFKNKALDSEINSLIKQIQIIRGVREIRLTSKEEAFRKFKDLNKDTIPEYSNLITLDMFRASVEVYLDDFSVTEQVRQVAKSKIFVDSVMQPSLGW